MRAAGARVDGLIWVCQGRDGDELVRTLTAWSAAIPARYLSHIPMQVRSVDGGLLHELSWGGGGETSG